jgi:hypothetical protein
MTGASLTGRGRSANCRDLTHTVRYLLDTNVLSQWMRPQPDAAVLAWVRQQSPGRLYTSAVTVAEIEAG